MHDLPALILSSGKRDVVIDPPIMYAAGFLGFADEARRHIDLAQLGAFVTNTLSLQPRSPANPPRLIQFPGGFLVHSGHPNPGLSRAISQYHRTWSELPVPVIVNLLARSPGEAAEMVRMLEGLENVMAVELLVQAEPIEAQGDLVEAACSGELPVIARVPVTASTILVKMAEEAGAQAVSLGPPRGTLRAPSGELVSGRIYSPLNLAFGLENVQRWRSILELPVLGSNGSDSSEHMGMIVQAGASGVQLDVGLWRLIQSE
jgi:dihydroorotate dehydrogenase (NAD+) catalytic subunit